MISSDRLSFSLNPAHVHINTTSELHPGKMQLVKYLQYKCVCENFTGHTNKEEADNTHSREEEPLKQHACDTRWVQFVTPRSYDNTFLFLIFTATHREDVLNSSMNPGGPNRKQKATTCCWVWPMKQRLNDDNESSPERPSVRGRDRIR